MGAPVVHFEIIGKDVKKLSSFYGKLFDWDIQHVQEMDYGMIQAQGKGIGGGIGPDPEGGNGHITFYMEVDDPQAYLDKAESLGGKTIMPVTVIPDMVTFALLADPEGHVVGVVKSDD